MSTQASKEMTRAASVMLAEALLQEGGGAVGDGETESAREARSSSDHNH